jgi:hypothetical protein
MATWTEINRKIDHFAGDPDSDTGRTFSEALRIEAWNWAQDQLCAHTPRQREETAEIDSDGRSIILPSDFLAVEGLYDYDEEQWWWPMRRRPGDRRLEDDDVLEFWFWGNKMYLESEITLNTDRLRFLYWAYWPKIEYSESVSGTVTVTQPTIYTPQWAELPLLHLVIFSTMVHLEVESSDLNQWRIRVESGDPLDNPRMASARWHLEMYERLVEKFPPARRTEIA